MLILIFNGPLLSGVAPPPPPFVNPYGRGVDAILALTHERVAIAGTEGLDALTGTHRTTGIADTEGLPGITGTGRKTTIQ